MSVHPYPLRIARAENDLLFDESGRGYVDLFSGHGAAWLGHANPAIASAVADQLGKVWIAGGLETPAYAAAKEAVEGFFPPSHALAGLYSTGMESAEFALRLARVTTGRAGVAGFERSMHGKSLATAVLGWDNKDGVDVPGFHRLPFMPALGAGEILARLAGVLANHRVGAVFVEPLQGSGGGYGGSAQYFRELSALCSAHGALLVFDEILTGFHRTGPPFAFSDLGFIPDVVLVGKAMGNGFPVSGVVADRRLPVRREMLPGSTFAGNPLAAAAVAATLGQMRRLDLPALVAAIEATVTGTLRPLERCGVALRGRGALWVLEPPPEVDVEAVAVGVYRRGVAIGFAGRLLRVFPAATIDPKRLEGACAVVAEELRRACA